MCSMATNKVWNMDESRITSVHQPGCRFQGGPSQVAKMTSGERGATVTVNCGVSAAGAYLPPFMIFPGSEWWNSWVPRHSQSATPVEAVGQMPDSFRSGWNMLFST